MSELRFYFDEGVELAVSQQLRIAGIDAVSAHSLGHLGWSDQQHLDEATRLQRVLCTYDTDFLRMATEDLTHFGIVYAPQSKATIGAWIRELRTLHATYAAEMLIGQVVFLSAK